MFQSFTTDRGTSIPMKAGNLVSIVKRAESPRLMFRAGNWETFEPGVFHPKASLPVDYEILGYLVEDITVGKPVILLRIARNGERVLGSDSASVWIPSLAMHPFLKSPAFLALCGSESDVWFLPQPLSGIVSY